MTKKTGTYIILIAGIILLLLDVSSWDFENLNESPYYGLIANILLILAMIISIRDQNKEAAK